jgi:predicted secreted hydrolase
MAGIFFITVLWILLPLYSISLPKDHQMHSASDSERVQFVGQIATENGGYFGYELSFFRAKKAEEDKEIMNVIHFSIIDLKSGKSFFYEELPDPKDPDKANGNHFKRGNFSYTIQDTNHIIINAKDPNKGMGIRLNLRNGKVLYHDNHDDHSRVYINSNYWSEYYSMTKLQSEGEVLWDDESFPGFGESWLDHEWSEPISFRKPPEDPPLDYVHSDFGWDKLILRWGDEDLLVYRIREERAGEIVHFATYRNSKETKYFFGNQIRMEPYPELNSWKSPNSKVEYPTSWLVQIPSIGLYKPIEPFDESSEYIAKTFRMTNRWKGMVRESQGPAWGYLELNGYVKDSPWYVDTLRYIKQKFGNLKSKFQKKQESKPN